MSQEPLLLVVYFTLLVGGLVFVHELGHFLVAKAFGVHVVRFSLGFGPRVAGLRIGGTEYVVSALPLGGYVQLLGEADLTDANKEAFLSRSFDGQHVLARMLIVTAGPLMSLAFPFVLFFFVFLGHTSLHPPRIGEVIPGMPADGFLEPGDRILAVDGGEVRSFDEVKRAIEARAGEVVELSIERGPHRFDVRLVPATVRPELDAMSSDDAVGRLGIVPVVPLPVIGVTSESSPAYASGLRTFDTVVAVGGEPIRNANEVDEALQGRGLRPVVYLRPERLENALGGMVELEFFRPRVATLRPGRLVTGELGAGVESADPYVRTVTLNSAEHRAGIRPLDRLVSVDGQPVRSFRESMERVARSPRAEHEYVVRRGEELHRLVVRFHKEESGGLFTPLRPIGIQNFRPYRSYEPVPNEARFSHALRESTRRTTWLVQVTTRSLGQLIHGRMGRDEIGGPLYVFFAAGDAAAEGAEQFLTLMAIISVNLGILNLLPIPLLDGGQLAFLMIESAIRRPIPARLRETATMVGWLGLVLLTLFALVNDVQRFFLSGGGP
jgi:regulator of sigma E protease